MSLYLRGLVTRAGGAHPAIRPPRWPRWLPPEAAMPDSPAPAPSRRAAAAALATEVAPVGTASEPPAPVADALPLAQQSYAPERQRPEMPQTPPPAASQGADPPTTARPLRSEGAFQPLPPAAADPAPPHEPHVPSPAHLPTAAEQIAAPLAPATTVIFRPVENPRAAEPAPFGAPDAEPAEATYIHIGRVELHAAPPAVTIQRAAAKPAAHEHMSLDEYLRRRSGRPQ